MQDINKYAIAREVEIEDFENAMEILDYHPSDFTDNEIGEMFDELNELLANDDVYNEIYNQCLCEVLKKYSKGDK